MGRGYWLPPKHECLKACDGYYIDSDAIYQSDQPDMEKDWNRFLERLCKRIMFQDQTLTKRCEWKPCDAGQSRFVVLQNQLVDIIVEDVDGYIAVYVIVPEDCKNPGYAARRIFPEYIYMLKRILVELYPGKIRKRLNSQHTASVC